MTTLNSTNSTSSASSVTWVRGERPTLPLTVAPSPLHAGTLAVLDAQGRLVESRHQTERQARIAERAYTQQTLAGELADALPTDVPVRVIGRGASVAGTPRELPAGWTGGSIEVGPPNADWTPRSNPHAFGYLVGLPVVARTAEGEIVRQVLLVNDPTTSERTCVDVMNGGKFTVRRLTDTGLLDTLRKAQAAVRRQRAAEVR